MNNSLQNAPYLHADQPDGNGPLPDVHGGGAIGKATVICLVLGIDAEMTMGELRRRLS